MIQRMEERTKKRQWDTQAEAKGNDAHVLQTVVGQHAFKAISLSSCSR